MANVTRIDWTIQTGQEFWSGTDDTVILEIYRDETLLKRGSLEPGRTPRLDRGSVATYYWVFQNPDGLGVSVSGTAVPYYEVFRDGVAGHLRVKLVATGDDAWEKVSIDSTVYTGNLRSVPGTIDSVKWVEDYEPFFFGQDVVITTTPPGYAEWNLYY
ncbi:hypothetical protein [Arthrobacter sp. LAR12-1-1.1]|uniref:hypothetical protein n=1 Tax=Arthrobacter sp. LAR12-1-1.1 TaxID=3135215 RepID=UPI00342A691C